MRLGKSKKSQNNSMKSFKNAKQELSNNLHILHPAMLRILSLSEKFKNAEIVNFKNLRYIQVQTWIYLKTMLSSPLYV